MVNAVGSTLLALLAAFSCASAGDLKLGRYNIQSALWVEGSTNVGTFDLGANGEGFLASLSFRSGNFTDGVGFKVGDELWFALGGQGRAMLLTPSENGWEGPCIDQANMRGGKVTLIGGKEPTGKFKAEFSGPTGKSTRQVDVTVKKTDRKIDDAGVIEATFTTPQGDLPAIGMAHDGKLFLMLFPNTPGHGGAPRAQVIRLRLSDDATLRGNAAANDGRTGSWLLKPD